MTKHIEHDTLRRFLIENTQVRGEWIHLEDAWQQIRQCRDYPAPVATLLGEATAAICLLSATLKFEGSLILQINSTGPITMLVVQATSQGEIRGLARFEEDFFNEPALTTDLTLRQLFGDGQIVISIVNENNTSAQDRYQGIVALDGASLADCLQAYFEQSEQLQTRLYLTANDDIAAGLLLQRLPGTDQTHHELSDKENEDWDHATALTDTIKPEELLELDKEELLHRLFHEQDVRLFDGNPICFQCTCSTIKIEDAIRSLGKAEAEDVLAEQGKIEIQCEFCHRKYVMDAIDIARIFDENIRPQNPSIH